MATVPPHHAADDLAGHLLRRGHRRHLRLPVLHGGLHRLGNRGGRRREPGQSAAVAAVLPDVAVPAGVPVLPHGLCVGHGLGAVPRRDAVRAAADQDVEAMGPLPGRVPIATATAVPPRAARRVVTHRPLPPGVRRHRFLVSVWNHSMAIVLAIIFVAPFVFVILTSLMTRDQALSTRLWPHPFEWGNFSKVFDLFPVWRYALNSFLYASLSMVGVAVSSVPVAYALSRMQWRGRQATFLVVLSTLMLPAFFGDAFSIFLLRQFFMTIPQELSDAARVDGAGEFQIMARVIVPLAKAGI